MHIRRVPRLGAKCEPSSVRPIAVMTMLSVIVPCMNEEAVIFETHQRLTQVLEGAGIFFELLYVDDGSTDTTPSILRVLQQRDSRVRVIRFSRNFGHQIAITAGLEHAKGDAMVIIDADLQDPPEVIAKFLKKWEEGNDVVYGVRAERDGETAFKLWTAKIFYRLINRLSDTRIPLDTGDFRLLDRKVVDALLSMPERDRYIRGMISWLGFSQCAVPYHRDARTAGVTKFSMWRMLHFATDGVVSFSILPLRLATWAGFLVSGLALLGIFAVVLEKYLHTTGLVRGWSSTVIAVLFMGGVQLVCLGIIGEYVGRAYGEAKSRPLYVVQERIGFEAQNSSTPAEVLPRTAAGQRRAHSLQQRGE
jgi:glycosyltransferase involved in cell wall biosynthesis